MNYKIVQLTNPSKKNIDDIISLYKEADWLKIWDTRRRIKLIIKKSYMFIAVLYEGDIIAMARVISDGINDAYIQDLKVRNDFRNKGLGTKIIDFIKTKLIKKGFKWIGLIAERDTEKFYIKNGFKHMKEMKFFIYEFKENK